MPAAADAATTAPNPRRPTPRHVLPVLTLAQFAGTSLWFAVNAVMPDLQRERGWPASAVGTLTSSLQAGFIVGTLVFALFAIADRHSTRRVFLVSSLLGALFTVGAWATLVLGGGVPLLAGWRFATGVCLAGIYPVGMKIASQWFPDGLGAALGVLIAALVLGSASAHGLRGLGAALPWPSVMLGVALLAAGGGVLLYRALPDPPAAAGRGAAFEWRALATLWTDGKVRASVLGYFGHMWELYTLWVLMPLILATRLQGPALSYAAFVVLGIGALGCAGGGAIVHALARGDAARGRLVGARVGGAQLAISGLCCAAAPWALQSPDLVFAAWLLVWGTTVSGDSPQFSALTAANAPRHAVGSVLTLTNSLGFTLSIVSIELFVRLAEHVPLGHLLPWLGLGPLLGVIAFRSLMRRP